MNDKLIVGKINDLSIDFSDLKKTIESLDKKFSDNEPIKWDLYIQKVDNGFVLTPPDKDESPIVIKCNDDEKETMTELLHAVYDHFISSDSMHNKWKNTNLRITFDEEGSHYDPPESCPLCDNPECHWTSQMEKYMKEIVDDNKNYYIKP